MIDAVWCAVQRAVGHAQRDRMSQSGREALRLVEGLLGSESVECPNSAANAKLAARIGASEISCRIIPLTGIRRDSDVQIEPAVGADGNASRSVLGFRHPGYQLVPAHDPVRMRRRSVCTGTP